MAGYFDRNWRVGSRARGTRSQFRLNTEGLLPFKCTYPVHLTDVMDAVPSTQADLRRANLVSPVRGTRTRAVREYEQAIDELKKENFDLKLRIFLLEETINKTLPKNKGSGCEDQDNVVQVIVELKVETETLRNELSNKSQLLQEALEQAEKYETDLRELQEKFVQQQEQLSAFAELPSAQEVRLIQDERENLLKENEELNSLLSEKVASLQDATAELEELSKQNQALESKVEKRSLAIQGIVYKYYRDIEMIPKEVRPIVQSAVLAAKENKEEELDGAIENFKVSLFELMSASSDGANNAESESRSRRRSPSKDSMEELQKSMGISKSFEELDQSSGKSHSKSKLAHDTKEHSTCQSLEKTHLSNKSSESLTESEKLSSREDLSQMMDVLRENEHLKSENQEKSQVIGEQNATINDLEQRMIQVQSELLDAVSKVKSLEMMLREERSKCTSSLPKMSSAVQTAVQWHLMQSKMSDKFLQSAGLSNNIDVLKEEILTLLLVIEQKDKEIVDLEESLQQQMEKIGNKQFGSTTNMDMDYLTERNELHQRLADCSAVNNDLLKHLRSLETFMENLLHHKTIESSLDSISQTSDFLSQLTSCLDQTLKLSNVLSDHLSVCEGSRLFDPNDSTMNKEFNPEEKSSYPLTDHSQMSVNTSTNQSLSQGRDNFQSSEQDAFKITSGTGKRRLSYSNLQKGGSENVVVLGTSNNEDLILLLNDKGDPEDVLIRNNHSHLDNPSFDNGDLLRRRCWDPSNTNQWNNENPAFSHHANNWYANQLLNANKIGAWYNHCPSSDSDIWSEPDRDVSLQRIGIDVQKSPVTQKSPRRSRVRGRSTDEPSSQKNESSSSVAKVHPWSKRRRCSDTSKSSFICKKCMSQSQQTDDVTREEKDEILKELDDLTEKCSIQQNQLKELHDLLRSKINLINHLNDEKQKLTDCIDPLKEELTALKNENKLLEDENSHHIAKVTEVTDENAVLREIIRGMEEKLSCYDTECDELKTALSQTKSKLSVLDSKCSDYSTKLTEVKDENTGLKETVRGLEVELSRYDSECKELKTALSQTRSKLTALDAKCLEYEEKLCVSSKDKEDCIKRLKELEYSSNELMTEVKALELEKKKLLQEIQLEKEAKERLEKEKLELTTSLKDSINLVSSLQSSCKSLEEKNDLCLREKEMAENNLLSSNSVCNELKKETGELNKLLDELKSKCLADRKELNEAAAFKHEICDKLMSSVSEFVSNLSNLERICNQYLNLEEVPVKDNDNLCFELLSDKDKQARRQLEVIVSANTILEQRLNLLSEALLHNNTERKELSQNINSAMQQLKTKEGNLEQLVSQNRLLRSKIDEYNQHLEKYKISNDQYKSKIESYQQHLNSSKNETKSLKDFIEELQNHTKELQQNVSDKEKSLESCKVKDVSLQNQVSVLQSQIQNDQEQLNLKDDEITQLQERIFNLQTQINSLLTEKMASNQQQRQSFSKDSGCGPGGSSNLSKDIGCGSLEVLNVSNTSTRTDAECDRTGNDTSVSSGMSEKDSESERRASDRHARKMKSLQSKLGISEKRVEILEKEKSDLREELMVQIEGGKRANKLSSDIEALLKELADVKGKLEAKTSFIRDLKKELQNSYNLLIEKQKEVDELYKFKRSVASRTETAVEEPLRKRFSDPLQLNTESNIKELKKHKWELVQDIFKQQKQFYERKNIHLGHFEKFRNHIEKLRSLQVSPLLQKSESEPMLNASMSANACYVEKCDRTLKNLQIELELDVECLQNFKIFLKRFFIPFVMQKCQCSKIDDPKNDGSGKNSAVADRKGVSLQIKSISDEKLVKSEAPKMDFEKSASMEALHSHRFSSSDRLVNAASVISHKVDSLKNILRSLKSDFQNVSDIESFSIENPRKAAAKSVLEKIFDEVSVLLEKTNEISELNSVLKTFDLIRSDVPKSPTKQDMSDRESLLSEETITLSRSGSLSPMSFEEHFPTKLVSSTDSKKQEEPENNPKATEDKGTAPLKVSHRSNPVGGSQESICQRSHFSSPDLGIESDPNHESSAPEQTESRNSRKWYDIAPKGNWSAEKQAPSPMYSRSSNNSTLIDDPSRMTASDSLHAIGMLQHYQLLKKEVQESLVGIKVVLSRTDDGLHHVAKYTSPRKNIECTTFKAIRDESLNIEMCLQEATKLVDGFWIAPCPSVDELKALIQQNHDLQTKLESLQEAKRRQQNSFEQAMDKLKNAEVLRENMEKNISRKLVKTKKVIREVETKMLHRRNQALPLLPKFPDEPTCQKEQ